MHTPLFLMTYLKGNLMLHNFAQELCSSMSFFANVTALEMH